MWLVSGMLLESGARGILEMVIPGSYIVATDGIMYDLIYEQRGEADWGWNLSKDAGGGAVVLFRVRG